MASKTRIVSDNVDAIVGAAVPAAGAFTNLTTTGILKYSGTPQTLTGAGAVNITSAITHLVTAGVGDALTLADGAEGQLKIIVMKTITTVGHTSVLTPTNFAQGTTITFNAVNCIITLLFTNGTWHWTGGRNVTLA